MAKIEIDSERCKGCSLCIEFCPNKCIALSQEINKAGYHPAIFVDKEKCSGCGFCFLMCPDVCIEIFK